MTRAPGVKSIDCTACGAGLDILGGGRVTTHICPYCGTELDALDGYKVLKRFGDLPRPDTPFAIGQSGTLKAVDWTVIGTLGLREDHGGRVWEWVEHQLYSATHGYAWLTVEDGHTTFSRRQRRLPRPDWMSWRWVETSENKPVVVLDGQRFTYLQTTDARLTFAEGEFTWAPQIGDVTRTISALSPDAMLDFSETGTEREIYRSEYLDPAATLRAFGLDAGALQPRGTHPLQPLRTTPTLAFIRWAASGFALLALVLGFLFSLSRGETVLEPRQLDLAALNQPLTFDLTRTDGLAGLYLKSAMQNAWLYLDFEVLDPEGETLFEAGRTMEFYKGRDSEGTWREGSTGASLYFLPTLPGRYSVVFGGSESGLWSSQGYPSQAARAVTVSVRQGMASGRPLFYAALGFAALAGVLWGRLLLHQKARWSHSDWDDD